jgi:hypothetical protein
MSNINVFQLKQRYNNKTITIVTHIRNTGFENKVHNIQQKIHVTVFACSLTKTHKIMRDKNAN